MHAKHHLIHGIGFIVGLVLTFKSFAQTSFLPDSTNETSKLIQSNDQPIADETMPSQKVPVMAPSQLPDWEKRFIEIANEDGSQQSELLRELAATVPEDQIQDALGKLVAEKAGPAMTLVVFLGQRWAEKSPADAAQWAEAHMSDDTFGNNLFSKIMVPWADKDLAGAVDWVQQLSANGNKTAAASSLATEAATLKKAVIAINLATNIPPGTERDEVLNYSAQQWAATDRDGAVAWINQVQDPVLREKMLGEVGVNLGVQDPAAGVKFVASEMPDGKDRDMAMSNVIRFWAASAPADAAAWVEQLPDGPLRDLALENLMDTWGRKNLTEARQWMNQLPAGHFHDIAANALVQLAK